MTGIIAEHSSVSQHYSKKKAIKMALRYALDRVAEMPHIQNIVEKRKIVLEEEKNRQKAEKTTNHLFFIEEKRQKRKVEKEKKRVEAKEREIRRVLNKQNAKNRIKVAKDSNS